MNLILNNFPCEIFISKLNLKMYSSENIKNNNGVHSSYKNMFRKRKFDDEVEPSIKRFKFQKVCGVKRNSECIYVPEQKLMYMKNVRNKVGQETFICYNYKKQKCLARMVKISKNTCRFTPYSKPHTCFGNHERFMTNNLLLRDIKNRALKVNRICGTEAFKISAQAIIDQEKSR